MAAKIHSVDPGSPAADAGIRAGETLCAVNGHPVADVLDYEFYSTDENPVLDLADSAGSRRSVIVKKEEYQPLGLIFETFLMDRKHHCENKCVFCFVDQLPRGMRATLYFKDDDDRLSFLHGNYITMTNLSPHEADRIVEMRISPVNISVHTTDPQLRTAMMGNPRAADSLKYLRKFSDAGIRMNTQLVLCPDCNDGDNMESSIRDLAALYPMVESIAVVPVGLTRHRDGLAPLREFTRDEAADTITRIHAHSGRFLRDFGERLVYPADEWFLKAGIPLPEADYYGEYPQLENGVGMVALLRSEFYAALDCCEEPLISPRRISLATGTAAAPFIRELVNAAAVKNPLLSATVFAIQNDFFGHSVTVAGLVTGGDLIRQLRRRNLGDELLIPGTMLRHERDIFLDDVSVEDVGRELEIPVRIVDSDGAALYDALLGR